MSRKCQISRHYQTFVFTQDAQQSFVIIRHNLFTFKPTEKLGLLTTISLYPRRSFLYDFFPCLSFCHIIFICYLKIFIVYNLPDFFLRIPGYPSLFMISLRCVVRRWVSLVYGLSSSVFLCPSSPGPCYVIP